MPCRTITRLIWKEWTEVEIIKLDLEIALMIVPLVREVVNRVEQSLGAELKFDIFLMLNECEVRFIMEPV